MTITTIEQFPEVNETGNFLVLVSTIETLADDWLDYIDKFLTVTVNRESQSSDNYIAKFARKYIQGSMNFLGAPESVLSTLGLSESFQVIQQVPFGGMLRFQAVMTYEDLLKQYIEHGTRKQGMYSTGTIIDRFFLKQWSEGKLLYPLLLSSSIIQRNYDLHNYIGTSDLAIGFKNHLDGRGFQTNTPQVLFSQMLSVFVAVSIRSLDELTEKVLTSLEHVSKEKMIDSKSNRRDYILYGCNEIRRYLISKGRTDITVPRDNSNNKRRETVTDQKYGSLKSIDVSENPSLAALREETVRFKATLILDRLAKGTIKTKMADIKNLFVYLITVFPGKEINTALIDKAFDPAFENNILKFSKDKEFSGKNGFIRNSAQFLKYCELLTPFALKHIPKMPQKRKIAARNAMPANMVRALRDILIHRPPRSGTSWQSEKADLSWWPHKDVYPVHPIMVLLHLYIPLRGGQIRNLCREQSFLHNEIGSITHFVINTDKNVHRESLQEIPNVWDDLKIVEPFLKWHKEYFPNLPEYVYNEDENTPWTKITPLMITPSNLRPMSQNSHMKYLKRLLLKYQIEENQTLEAMGKEPTVSVIWPGSAEVTKPKNVEEVDTLTEMAIDKFKSCYDIHSLRVTGATRYLEAGLGINLVMMLTGHATPEMLMRIYVRLTMDEKKKHLQTAINKIYTGELESLVDATTSFVRVEIPAHYDVTKPEERQRAIDENGLFSLFRKAPDYDSTEMDSGERLAMTNHPSTWFPMIHGICPGVQCPVGREKKCSLCPYLITGKIFLEGVVHQANLSLIHFHRASTDISEEESSGNYESHAKRERLDLLLEEVLGWWEIIQEIEDRLVQNPEDSQLENVPMALRSQSSLVDGKTVPQEIAYLEANYDAIQLGIERDREGLAVLAISAYNLARETGEDQEIIRIVRDDKKLIDWLMGHYSKYQQNNLLPDFIAKLRGENRLRLP